MPAALKYAQENITRFCDFHVLRVVAAAQTDRADDLIAILDRVPATDHDESRRVGDAMKQRRIVLDELPPLMRRDAETDRGECLVLGNLQRQFRGAVHPQEHLQITAFVGDRDTHDETKLRRLAGGTRDCGLGRFGSDAHFGETGHVFSFVVAEMVAR